MLEILEQIVARPEELKEACTHLASASRLGFDTEFIGEDAYRPRLCLLQLATETRLILIDPLTAGPLDELWRLLVEPARQVIVHAAREELRFCRLWTGQTPANFIDLQVAAGLVGLHYPLSSSALVGHLLGVRLAKSETLTEWDRRPLTPSQIHYAFDDVRFLLQVWTQLAGQLERLGRMEWAKEEFARLARATMEEKTALEKWRRLRGLGSLDRRQLAVVRELFQWREEVADRTNRPPRTLCRDDLLIEIARRNPKKPHDLHVVRGLARRDAETILAVVERARALPLDQCPARAERDEEPPQLSLLTDFLSAALGHLCVKMQLAPKLVATSRDLHAIARSAIEGEPAEFSLLDEGWRKEHIRPWLASLLSGEKSLRIARVGSEAPFEFLGGD